MKTIKKIAVFIFALLTAASAAGTSFADDNVIIEIIPETSEVKVTIKPDENNIKISPYIYGINDKGNINGISPTVIKQTGTSLSSYNWETNNSNPGIIGANSNDISLVSNYPSSKWNTPALYTDTLISRAVMSDIPVRLVTLQMMGYVAKDSMGIVNDDIASRTSRWCRTFFSKNDTYLNQPDIDDDVVYIDEYVSYLVNRYGSAAEGGINGYFLDSEPDLWDDNFSVLGLDHITPDELTQRSVELSSSIKAIDNKAFVFGPSLSGLQGCINLNDPQAWNTRAAGEYSWFLDYYLSYMREQSEMRGYRLLDVLDIHYYTEALTPVGIPVLTNSDEFSNAYRMQAVNTLWNSDYTENSVTVLMNKQFTPVIPTLQASIRINYPGTRLSFSEYDFGGGNNISGAIAQTDVLGTFAKENVYLACLSPVSEDYSFQKAALNLFTNYDSDDSGFGDTLVYSDNEDDYTSSVYAAVDSGSPDTLRIILTNKNMVNDKHFDISIDSELYDYQLKEAYTIDSSAKIVDTNLDNFDLSDNTLKFDADTTSVYMLVLSGEFNDEITDETDNGDEGHYGSSSEPTQSDITEISDIAQPNITSENSETTVSSEGTTVPDIMESTISTQLSEPVSTQTTPIVAESTANSSFETEDITQPEISDDKPAVAMPVKILGSVLAAAVALGVAYILIFDKK